MTVVDAAISQAVASIKSIVVAEISAHEVVKIVVVAVSTQTVSQLWARSDTFVRVSKISAISQSILATPPLVRV